jgi:methyl-accepting chemotaxis protein
MLNKLSINIRMLAFIVLPAIFFIVIGYFALEGLGKDYQALKTSDSNFRSVIAATEVTNEINKHYALLLSNINSGLVYWQAADELTKEGIAKIQASMDNFKTVLTAGEQQSELIQRTIDEQQRLIASYTGISKIFSADALSETGMSSKKRKSDQSKTKSTTTESTADGEEATPSIVSNKEVLNDYIYNEMYLVLNPLTEDLNRITKEKYDATTATSAAAIESSETITNEVLMYIFGGILTTMLFGNLIMQSITKPTQNLTKVVHRLSEGEFDARVEVAGKDEFFRLGTALNGLLDDRAVTLETIDAEHQQLNQSVFSLLQAVAELSERNLTIRANVTEDATGPVADAINLLAEETSSTLTKVRNVAKEVNETSQKVNTHLMSVNKLAMKEQERAIETADQMSKMLTRLDSIANSAAETNVMADNTTASTKKAHKSVSDTLSGMSVIRETVQETGKRIKQLGERSQEISHVIEIINTIAERTTVLALNASMQAVAAGDAGRGFSVIAEEIQRLAESSRESTGQISTLVRNIQQETNTTIATMDQTIEQVIDGSTKAEDAAEQMQKVLETTSELVLAVDQIAIASRDQVGISEGLKHKAEGILKSTQSTGQELLSLTGLSRNMADYAQQLVKSVNVFTLDKDEPNYSDDNQQTSKV